MFNDSQTFPPDPLEADVTADHARLKSHIASMEGGLEAKINEGGKWKPCRLAWHQTKRYC